MSYSNPYQTPHSYTQVAAQADLTDRLGFIRRTYFHLALAIIALMGLEFMAFQFFAAQLEAFANTALGGRGTWLLLLGGFLVVSWVADSWARSGASPAKQYLGLGLYVVAEAIILAPLLWLAHDLYPGAIQTAAMLTGAIFVVLTTIVFITRQDFSFLRNFLIVGGLAAMGCVLVFVFAPANSETFNKLHLIFSIFMVVLASGYILYKTSNVLHHYHTDQHVAASLALFASVALLFWYILQIVMSRR